MAAPQLLCCGGDWHRRALQSITIMHNDKKDC
jgi:hypothetical protein